MSTQDELTALQKVDETIAAISDPNCRDRIINWIISKYASDGIKKPALIEPVPKVVPKKAIKRISSPSSSGKKSTKLFLTIDKSLNTRPKGKKSLQEVTAEKKPETDREKVVVCVYYLVHVLELSPINQNHVYTCYKNMNWRLPSNLIGVLRWVASQKGWLDTSDIQNIRMTTHGENLVEHDLPRKEKVKK